MLITSESIQKNKDYTFVSWMAQGAWNPIIIERGEGVYVYDTDGKRYLDWASQLVNVNIGHSHPKVVSAIQKQAAKLCYVNPSFGTPERGRLGELLAEITPGDLSKSLFTNGGADAVENALKIARAYTGRQKILTRYNSYHGGTFAAATAGGDPRRLSNEPGVPWIVRTPDPYSYRNPVYRGRTQEEGDEIIAEMVEDIVIREGPENCAAILVEGYSGSSGIMQPSAVYFNRLREICDRYGMLFMVDEVMSGFGRTGEWFGIDHYPNVRVDVMTVAKGITAGYVPLGATIVSRQVAEYFDKNTLWAGLTYSAHTLAMAAGIATVEVYREENLIGRAREMGEKLSRGLAELAERHAVIGEVRGTGLLQVIELVKNRETREPLSEFNKPLSEPLQKVSKALRDAGLNVFTRWNMIFCTPPLTINYEQLRDGLDGVDQSLTLIDGYYEG
jgi:taurine--2-oxoglutarate transaminase